MCSVLIYRYIRTNAALIRILIVDVLIIGTFVPFIARLPRCSYITDEYIVFERGIGKLRLPRAECEAKPLPKNAFKGCIRTNGISQPYLGQIGWYNSQTLGKFYMLRTNYVKNLSLLEHNGTKYVFVLDTTQYQPTCN